MAAPRYLEVKIENITLFQYNFIILLRHQGEDDVLPICVAAAEARSIAAAFNNQSFPRPLTHDLMKNLLELVGCAIDRITITDLKDGTFYALIRLLKDGEYTEVDSRPSDAIALAIRFGSPIYVREDILRANAVNIHQTTSDCTETEDDDTSDDDDDELEPISEEDGATAREMLQRRLQRAIAEERYEEAALLRDELTTLENEN